MSLHYGAHVGTLSQSEKDITVYHLNGQYTIGLFDHVRVHVTSTISHAHGHHLSLQLLSCGSVPPSTPNVSEGMKQRDDRRKNTNRELVKVSPRTYTSDNNITIHNNNNFKH